MVTADDSCGSVQYKITYDDLVEELRHVKGRDARATLAFIEYHLAEVRRNTSDEVRFLRYELVNLHDEQSRRLDNVLWLLTGSSSVRARAGILGGSLMSNDRATCNGTLDSNVSERGSAPLSPKSDLELQAEVRAEIAAASLVVNKNRPSTDSELPGVDALVDELRRLQQHGVLMMRQVVEAVEQAPMTVLECAVTRFPFGKNRRDQVPLAILASCLGEISRPADFGPSPLALRHVDARSDGCASGAAPLDAEALRAATSVSALAAALARMPLDSVRAASPPLTSPRPPPPSMAQAVRRKAHVLDLYAGGEYGPYADLSM
eukprot:NODE_9451_length_1424_cov_3.962992.p1 GENE.NODE_9451_length_1424_cov_3.962992~~NODE_9451_length_1424_cov_3.962992.p1  ORF type:complete len:320 (+),score=57.74 NODE_9451_length_1424_cov_3.962992:168-1127(+)